LIKKRTQTMEADADGAAAVAPFLPFLIPSPPFSPSFPRKGRKGNGSKRRAGRRPCTRFLLAFFPSLFFFFFSGLSDVEKTQLSLGAGTWPRRLGSQICRTRPFHFLFFLLPLPFFFFFPAFFFLFIRRERLGGRES